MAAVVYTCHIWTIFYEIHETFKKIHIMGFHCNKYPYTIQHRVFFKTFCENIFKRHLLEILPDTYDSSNGHLLATMDSGFTALGRR